MRRLRGVLADVLATYEGSGMDARSVASEYLASLDVRPRTRDAYGKRLRYFLDWLEVRGTEQPRRADILEYKEHVCRSYTVTTASSYLTAVRGLFSWLNAETGYPDIARGIKNPKSKRAGHLKDALSAEQARRVLDSIDVGTVCGKRDYAVCALMICTGVRVAEVSRANIGDMRYIDGVRVLYVWGKGRDERDEYVKLTQPVQDAIAGYTAARTARHGRPSAESALFVSESTRNAGGRLSPRSVSRIAKGALVGAGLDDTRLTAHSLRHTAVTLSLKGGASIRDAQQMARHGSPVTTERYAHDLRRLEDAAEDAVTAMIYT